MVTYGPWQEGREYTETWTLAVFPGSSNFGVVERTMTPYPAYVDGSTPPTINQWDGFGGLRLGNLIDRQSQVGGAALEGPPEIADPRFDTPAVSGDAWDDTQTYDSSNVTNNPANALLGEGGVQSPTIRYSGSFEPEFGSFGWIVHRETWVVNQTEYTPRYSVRVNAGQPFLQIPLAPTPRHLYAEIDPERATTARLSEAVSLRVDYTIGSSPDISQNWHFFIKDIGDISPGWLVGSDPPGDQSVNGMKSGSFDGGHEGFFEFDVSLINQWKVLNGTSSSAYFVPAELLPHIGIAWTGGWPGNTTQAPEPPEYPADPTVTFTYKFNTPRWRWVFADDETVPYRRVFPRDDALAGGAGRVYPQSRSVQSSNRPGGYL